MYVLKLLQVTTSGNVGLSKGIFAWYIYHKGLLSSTILKLDLGWGYGVNFRTECCLFCHEENLWPSFVVNYRFSSRIKQISYCQAVFGIEYVCPVRSGNAGVSMLSIAFRKYGLFVRFLHRLPKLVLHVDHQHLSFVDVIKQNNP